MKRSSFVLAGLVIAFFAYLICRPAPSAPPAEGQYAAAVAALLSEPIVAVVPYSDWDLAEVARQHYMTPEQVQRRLTTEEIGFLVGFGQSVSVAKQVGAQWDAVGHISDLNRYAFLIERLQRISDRFEAGTVRRIYTRFGFTTLYLSDADIAAMANMGPVELIAWLNQV